MLSLGGAIMVLAAAILACGKVEHTKVEQSIKDKLATKKVDLKSLTCPDRPLKKGDKFDCNAEDVDGQPLVFHVEQMDAKGSVDWKLDGMIIDMASVGDNIEKTVGAAADVQCPNKSVILKVGQSFTCDAQIGAQKHKVVLTLTDDQGTVSWKLKN